MQAASAHGAGVHGNLNPAITRRVCYQAIAQDQVTCRCNIVRQISNSVSRRTFGNPAKTKSDESEPMSNRRKKRCPPSRTALLYGAASSAPSGTPLVHHLSGPSPQRAITCSGPCHQRHSAAAPPPWSRTRRPSGWSARPAARCRPVPARPGGRRRRGRSDPRSGRSRPGP